MLRILTLFENSLHEGRHLQRKYTLGCVCAINWCYESRLLRQLRQDLRPIPAHLSTTVLTWPNNAAMSCNCYPTGKLNTQKLNGDIMFSSRLLTLMRRGRPKKLGCWRLSIVLWCCCDGCWSAYWGAEEIKLDCTSFSSWRHCFRSRFTSEPLRTLRSGWWSKVLIADSMRLWCAWTGTKWRKFSISSRWSCLPSCSVLCCADSEVEVGEHELLTATTLSISAGSSPTVNVATHESLITVGCCCSTTELSDFEFMELGCVLYSAICAAPTNMSLLTAHRERVDVKIVVAPQSVPPARQTDHAGKCRRHVDVVVEETTVHRRNPLMRQTLTTVYKIMCKIK